MLRQSLALLGGLALANAVALLPPTEIKPPLEKPLQGGGQDPWRLESAAKAIYIEADFADLRDDDGLTLIPPSGYEYAQVLQQDLAQVTGFNWSLARVDSLPALSDARGAILLGPFPGDADRPTYQDGSPTSEAYELQIAAGGVAIRGSGSRGMFWGTRTVLQMIMVSADKTLAAGAATDRPAFATRGYMFDAGRKWYNKGFLMEMCSYASFFKMNEFHYHLSDNYPLNRGRNDSWQDVYSHFSLLPEDESLLGIVHGRANETLSRGDYAQVQAHCAARGVAVVPEIEAPGHCLYVTKWKPELSLDKRDLLNLTHPDTVPTIQRIWAEFLPWFHVREVHVGADEYDATLADDYITFVNEMADFVDASSGKRIRIWGTPTDKPQQDIAIDSNVVVQHWQYGQSDPLDLVARGHQVINSEDWWAYMGLKNDHTPILPATYPQFFNESRILDFAEVEGWQWTPADYNPFNTTMQLHGGEPLNRGAVMAAWNDNGPDASTQLEMYYAMRRGVALVGTRAWTGSRGPEIDPDVVAPSIDFFSPRAPAQNLDRTIPAQNMDRATLGAGQADALLTWSRPRSRNQTGDALTLGYGSKGMNWTLTLDVTGPFELSSQDNVLSLQDDGTVVFNADGYVYPLRQVTGSDALELDPGHPGRVWVNTSSTHEPVVVKTPATVVVATDVEHGSVVWVDGELAGRFEVFIYGGRNTYFSWSQMAFVAPLETVRGSGLDELVLQSTFAPPGDGGAVPPPGSEAPMRLFSSVSLVLGVAAAAALVLL